MEPNNKEKLILRDYLAIDRTKLANERTFLSYLRTSFYLILAGISFLQLKEFHDIQWIGYVLFFLSIILLPLGIYKYIKRNNDLKSIIIYK